MPACIQNPVIENVGSDRAFSVLMQIKAQTGRQNITQRVSDIRS